MTQEDKELLFQDLCCRLPYGVKVNISASRPDRYDNFVKSINDATINSIDLNIEKCKFKEFWWDSYIVNVRPYLRPMSSMTEEEKKKVCSLNEISLIELNERVKWKNMYIKAYTIETFNYFNTKHLDYRGLIKKGLALEATEGMYDIKM